MKKIMLFLSLLTVIFISGCTDDRNSTVSNVRVNLYGEDVMMIRKGAVFEDPGAYAQDLDGNPVDVNVSYLHNGIVVETFDTNLDGSYKILYSAGSGDNLVSASRTIMIYSDNSINQELTKIELTQNEIHIPSNISTINFHEYLIGYDQNDAPIDVLYSDIIVTGDEDLLAEGVYKTPGTYTVKFQISGKNESTYTVKQMLVLVDVYANDFMQKGAGYGYNFLGYSATYFTKSGIRWTRPIINLGLAQSSQSISTNQCSRDSEITSACGTKSHTTSVFSNSQYEMAKEIYAGMSVDASYFGFQVGVDASASYAANRSSNTSYWKQVVYMNTNSVVLTMDNYGDYVTGSFKNDLIELNDELSSIYAVEGIPDFQDIDYVSELDSEAYELIYNFFSKYGTHLITNAAHGGVLTLEKEFNESMSDTALSLGLGASVSAGRTSVEVYAGYDMNETFANQGEDIEIRTIGGISVQQYSMDQVANWAISVEEGNTDVIGINDCMAIWELVTDSNTDDANSMLKLFFDVWAMERNVQILDNEGYFVISDVMQELGLSSDETDPVYINQEYTLPTKVGNVSIVWEYDENRVQQIDPSEILEGEVLEVEALFTYIDSDSGKPTSLELTYYFKSGSKLDIVFNETESTITQVDYVLLPGTSYDIGFLYDNDEITDVSKIDLLITLYDEILYLTAVEAVAQGYTIDGDEIKDGVDIVGYVVDDDILFMHNENSIEDYYDCIYIDEEGNLVVADYAPDNLNLTIAFIYEAQMTEMQIRIEANDYSYYGFSGGNGGYMYPFLITTKEQLLDKVRNIPDLHFELAADIEITGSDDFLPIGDFGDNNIIPFTGVFNGAGHSIDMIISDSNNLMYGLGTTDAYTYFGLFAKTNKAHISNLTLIVDLDFDVGVRSENHIGAVSGYDTDSIFENIEIFGSIDYTRNVSSWSVIVGGLIGTANNSHLTLVSNNADINIANLEVARGGGLIGSLTNGDITYSINRGDIYVDGANYVTAGGFIGWTYKSTITRSLNIGFADTPDTNDFGAFIGHAYYNDVSFFNCLYLEIDPDFYSNPTADSGEPYPLFRKTALELQEQTLYRGTDDEPWSPSWVVTPHLNINGDKVFNDYGDYFPYIDHSEIVSVRETE